MENLERTQVHWELDSQLLAATKHRQSLGARAGSHAQATINEHGHQLAIDYDGNGKDESMQESCYQSAEEQQIVYAASIAKELMIVDSFHLGLFRLLNLFRFRLASGVSIAILRVRLGH